MVRVKSTFSSNNIKLKSLNLRNSVSNKKEVDVFVIYLYFFVALGMCFLLPEEHFSTAFYYTALILSAVMFAGIAQRCKTTFFLNVFMGISFLVLFFNLGFRNYSGIDDESYINIFLDVSQNGWFSKFQQSTMEPGYLILNQLVSLFTENYLYMQLTSSFIPLFLFYYGFKKYRNLISIPMAVFLLCTFLYFQILSVGLVRMFIAMSIVFNAFYYIPQRNIKRYVLLIIIASLFHYSALFMLVLTYFALNKDNLSKRTKRFVVIGFVATPFIYIAIANYLVPLMGSRYSNYGTVDSLSLGLSSFDTFPILLLLFLFHKKFSNEKADYFKIFLAIYALSCIISFYSSMVSLGRLIFYANLGFFLATSMVSKYLNRNSKKLVFHAVIVLYGFLYVYRAQFTLVEHIPNLFPYQNIFFLF
ncbi:EpsG family protein [Psychrobacillus sp. INOP01]|uniref:EpsG family protein n=1 Tax=Psychrobacillus sp. INOP01 TaxID=2829187 RepID=UPI001BAA6583|nr:EpsG family protein [Psychrobacillus sp. INOP01]QUG40595.1 EpsG family protein [Psychrobacillus sp. INOP01]